MKKISLLLIALIHLQFGFAQSIDLSVLAAAADFRNATCQLIIDGQYTCSGTLINNTDNNRRSLILTAAHCIDSPDQVETIVAVFGEHKLLHNSTLDTYGWQSAFGAKLLAYDESLDFALIELNEMVPDELNPIYCGWDASGGSVSTTTMIHYPSFGFSEIAHNRQEVNIETFNGLIDPIQNGHWTIPNWSFGESLIGSSGAPLLNQRMEVIGALSGTTFRGSDSTDYFYKINKAWRKTFPEENQLAIHLDPNDNSSFSHKPLTIASNSNLYKISNYDYLDTASDISLGRDSVLITSHFPVRQGLVHGIYLTVTNIDSDLLNTIEISILGDLDEIIYQEEYSLFKLTTRSENYLPLLTPQNIMGTTSIAIALKTQNPTESLQLPTIMVNQQSSVLYSLLVENNNDPSTFEKELIQSPIKIIPNPCTSYFVIDTAIKGVSAIDRAGRNISLSYYHNYTGQAVVNTNHLSAGVYIITIWTTSHGYLTEKIIVRN